MQDRLKRTKSQAGKYVGLRKASSSETNGIDINKEEATVVGFLPRIQVAARPSQGKQNGEPKHVILFITCFLSGLSSIYL